MDKLKLRCSAILKTTKDLLDLVPAKAKFIAVIAVMATLLILGIVISSNLRSPVNALCRTVYGEARGLPKMEQAAVVWCVLNRVDDPRFPNTILDVVQQPYQFSGYKSNFPVTSEIKELVKDVLNRYKQEKKGNVNVGRVLPKEYCWFTGDLKHNYFRDAYSAPYHTWDWSLPNPYK